MDLFSAISRFCEYQERCHREVRSKLYDLGCSKEDVEQHITALIEKGLLNEQRYAVAIVRGKFNVKRWGRRKIVHQLKANHVSEPCIRKALEEIDPDEYYDTLSTLANRKYREATDDKIVLSKQNKVYRYLLQKGYE